MSWITDNLGTLSVGLVVLVIVALAVFVLVRDKRRRSRGACPGCGGSSCSYSGCNAGCYSDSGSGDFSNGDGNCVSESQEGTKP